MKLGTGIRHQPLKTKNNESTTAYMVESITVSIRVI